MKFFFSEKSNVLGVNLFFIDFWRWTDLIEIEKLTWSWFRQIRVDILFVIFFFLEEIRTINSQK